jgi:hypothetical protein
VINECTIGLITPYTVHGILTIELDRSFGTIKYKIGIRGENKSSRFEIPSTQKRNRREEEKSNPTITPLKFRRTRYPGERNCISYIF